MQEDKALRSQEADKPCLNGVLEFMKSHRKSVLPNLLNCFASKIFPNKKKTTWKQFPCSSGKYR